MGKKENKSHDDSNREKINEDLNNIKQSGKTSESNPDFIKDVIACYMVIQDYPPSDEDDSDNTKIKRG